MNIFIGYYLLFTKNNINECLKNFMADREILLFQQNSLSIQVLFSSHFPLVMVQFQYHQLYQKSSFSIFWYRCQIQKSTIYWSNRWIIESPLSKRFRLFAKFWITISTKMAPNPYMETLISKHWYWKPYRTYRCTFRLKILQRQSQRILLIGSSSGIC